MEDLAFLSAVELGALLRERQLSAAEVVEGALRRIEAHDPQLGAFVDLDGDRALAAAGEIAPDDRRLLAGIPVAIKANTPAEGWTMDYGCGLLDGHKADHDAHLVRRLRDEGCIVVGSTKLPEFGILPSTEPSNAPPARNPWNTSRTPGGSSGGSAAAVAAGLLPFAHANDGGGSIRIPAACCGLVGLKPSRGRVSRGPDSGDSFLVSDGVVSRTVLDTAVALDVMAGYEAGDATWAPPPDVAYTTAINRDPGHLRVHVLTDNVVGAALAPEHRTAIETTAAALNDLGHEVETISPDLPGGEETMSLFLTAFGSNVALSIAHAQLLAGREATAADLEPLSWALWELGRQTPSTQYLITIALLQAMTRQVMALWAGCDIILMPALAERPPEIGTLTGAGGMEAFDRAASFAPYAALFNVTGQPAITVPAGVADDGLPVAVQLVGRPLAEDTLLQVARQLEVAQPWAAFRPPLT